MRATRPLVRRGLRQHRGQSALIAGLVAIAALLLNIALLLATSYASGIEDTKDRLDGEDISLLVASQQAADDAQDALWERDGVTQVATQELLASYCTLDYNGSDTTTACTLAPRGEQPELGRSEVVAESATSYPRPIWAPVQLRDGGEYALGDTFTLVIAGADEEFQIQGFITSIFGSSLSMGRYAFEVSADEYQALSDVPGVGAAWVVSALVSDHADPEEITAQVTDQLATQVGTDAIIHGLDITTYRAGNAIAANLIAVLLATFAVVIAIIAVVVIRFAIRSTLERDIITIGALKAAGFSSALITVSIAVPWVLITTVSAIVGVVATRPLLAPLGELLTGQTGIPWNPGLGLTGGLGAILILTVTVVASSILSARRVRSLAPADALRGGSPTHTFRRNKLPLRTARGSIPTLLGRKLASRRPQQAVMVAVLIAMLGWASAFAVGLYDNVLGNPDRMVTMMMGDNGDVQIDLVPTTDPDGALERLVADPDIDRALYLDSTQASVGSRVVALTVSDDFSTRSENGIYSGRLPQYSDEVAIGGYLADATETQVGDEIAVTLAGTTQTYLVTGLVQSGERLGMNAMMTTEAIDRLYPQFVPRQVIAYLTDGADPATVVERLRTELGEDATSVVDVQEYADSQLGSYFAMASGIAIGILLITALVIVLVTTLTTTTFLREHRRDLATLGALGMRTADKTALALAALLPTVTIGAAIGLGLGAIGVNPTLAVLLRSVGLRTFDGVIPTLALVATGVGMVALATLLVLVLTRLDRGLTARELMAE